MKPLQYLLMAAIFINCAPGSLSRCTAQNTDGAKHPWFKAFDANGQLISGEFQRFRDVFDTLWLDANCLTSRTEEIGKTTYNTYYYALTNKVACTFVIGDMSNINIGNALHKFNYNSYINEYDYFSDVRRMALSMLLTKDYADKYFGQPDSYTVDSQNDTTYTYLDQNLVITFFNGGIRDTKRFDVIPLKSMYKKSLGIENLKTYIGEYYCGVEYEVTNYAFKVIKYIDTYTTTYNRVGDRISDGKATCIGPLEFGHIARCALHNIAYTRVGHHVKITKMVIRYTDGTYTVLGPADIKAITAIDFRAMDSWTLPDY